MKQLLFVAAAGIVLTACVGTPKEEMTVAEGAEMECRSVYESGSILPKLRQKPWVTWRLCGSRAAPVVLRSK
jgi:hypothetical protein